MIENDKATRKRAEKFMKEDKREIDNAAHTLLSSNSGREYLWWLLSISRIGQNAHTNNALSTAFNCGEQNIGQQILAHILEINPAGYVQMMREQQEKDDRRTNRSDGRSADRDE